MGIDFEIYGKALKNKLTQCDHIMKDLEKQIDDYKSLITLLNNWKPSTQQVIVPLSRLIYVPGQISNTHEFILFIGNGYYAKISKSQASEIIKLRITRIESQIQEINKSKEELYKKLFMKDQILSMLEFDKNIVEIKEDFDMETEKTWREKHKANLSKYYKNQATRNKYKAISNNFEELDSMEIEDKIDTLINFSLPNFSLNENISIKQTLKPPEKNINGKRIKWDSYLEQSQIDSKTTKVINPMISNETTAHSSKLNINKPLNEIHQKNESTATEIQNNVQSMPKSILKVNINSKSNIAEAAGHQNISINDILQPDELMISETCRQIQNINIVGDIKEKLLTENHSQLKTFKFEKISQFKKDKLAQRKKK